MLKLAARLARDCPMTMREAIDMPLSFERAYYRSEAWKARREELEIDGKYKVAVLDRIGQLITVTARTR